MQCGRKRVFLKEKKGQTLRKIRRTALGHRFLHPADRVEQCPVLMKEQEKDLRRKKKGGRALLKGGVGGERTPHLGSPGAWAFSNRLKTKGNGRRLSRARLLRGSDRPRAQKKTLGKECHQGRIQTNWRAKRQKNWPLKKNRREGNGGSYCWLGPTSLRKKKKRERGGKRGVAREKGGSRLMRSKK